MAIREPKKLYQGSPATSAEILYTVPGGMRTTVVGITVCNTNMDTAWITLHLVPSGGAVANSNCIMPTVKLTGTNSTDGGGIFMYEMPIPLSAGDTIRALQGTSGAISALLVGLEEVV